MIWGFAYYIDDINRITEYYYQGNITDRDNLYRYRFSKYAGITAYKRYEENTNKYI